MSEVNALWSNVAGKKIFSVSWICLVLSNIPKLILVFFILNFRRVTAANDFREKGHNLRNSELNYYVPRPRTESAKGSLHYRGSVLWNKIPSEIRKLPSLNVFKTSFHGKDFSNTPWLIVTLIIHNVSFCIFNIIVNSSLEYFSLVLNTIPRKTM